MATLFALYLIGQLGMTYVHMLEWLPTGIGILGYILKKGPLMQVDSYRRVEMDSNDNLVALTTSE